MVAVKWFDLSYYHGVALGYFRWKAWCRHFRYAGLAENLHLNTLALHRTMDMRYVRLNRALQHPRNLRVGAEDNRLLSDNAESYLRNLIGRPGWQQVHWGFLLEGAAALGKTRLCVEWLRQRPRSLLLLPHHDSLPQPHPRLQIYEPKGVLLFLDDLDQYAPILDSLCRFCETLYSWRIPLLVVATVRDGGPGLRIQTESVFQQMRYHLEHFVLAPLTDAQAELVGKELKKPPPEPQKRDASFSWLLEELFLNMERRFDSELSDRERCLLRAASLLDRCGIPITRERWIRVACDVFALPTEPDIHQEALTSLGRLGFLSGASPEPCYLRHVVQSDYDLGALESKLAHCLNQRKDGAGLYYWGTHMALQSTNRDGASAKLQKAVLIGKASGRPEGREVAALAAWSLGANLDKAGEEEKARQAWQQSVNLGKARGTAAGQEAGALAALNVGVAFDLEGKDEKARQAWQQSVNLGKASGTPAGQGAAAQAAFNLGVNLRRVGNGDEASQAWREAVNLGKASGTPEGLEVAGFASWDLGAQLSQTGCAEEATQAWQEICCILEASENNADQVPAERLKEVLRQLTAEDPGEWCKRVKEAVSGRMAISNHLAVK